MQAVRGKGNAPILSAPTRYPPSAVRFPSVQWRPNEDPSPPRPSVTLAFFRGTAVVGATTLLSRITGLAREMVFAAIIPAVMLEVYVLANQIPNLLRRLFAEGAFSQAFVPVVAEYRAKRS